MNQECCFLIRAYWQFSLLLAEYSVIGSEWHVRSSNVTGFQWDGKEDITENGTSVKFKLLRHMAFAGIFSFSWSDSLPAGQGNLTVEVSLPHSDTPYSVGLLWTSDEPVASDNAQHSQGTDIHAPGGIRTCNPTKRPHTHALGRSATSTCFCRHIPYELAMLIL